MALHWRIPQVGLFALSAGLRAVLRRPRISPANAVDQWQQLPPPTTRSQLPQTRAVVTYHPWYNSFDVPTTIHCLEELAALGASYVRTDVRWSDVLPDGVTIDESAFTWYSSFFRTAVERYQLQPLIVLSNASDIVLSHGRRDHSWLLGAWRRYIEAVVTRLGDICTHFQVLNEINNPVYAIFPAEQVGPAITSAAGIIRAQVADSQIIVNFLVDLLGWKEAIEDLLRAAGASVDTIALDHYPGTWTFSDSSDWDGILSLQREIKASSADSPWHGHSLAVLETGYSTNVPWFRNGSAQADYYRQLAVILDRFASEQPGVPLTLVGFYELSDMDTHALVDPEAHFGLISSDTLQRKPAFAIVQQICHSLRIG